MRARAYMGLYRKVVRVVRVVRGPCRVGATYADVHAALTVADRIDFWARLHERLGKLSNRVDAAMQGKILGDVYVRVPMVTPDEQRALQLENAKLEAAQWSAIGGIADADIAGGALLIKHHEAVIAAARPVVDIASEHEQAAQARVAAIERGDVVEGLGKPRDFAELCKQIGLTEADLRHCRWMADSVTDEIFREFCAETVRLAHKGKRRRDKEAMRNILRRRGGVVA